MFTTVATGPGGTRPLEELAAALPGARFSRVLTVRPDQPAALAVIARSDATRQAEVIVLDTPDGAGFLMLTAGGSLRIADAHHPRIAAETIAWTLGR